jgi:HPt (histidine-containing phosphotransfer) domain-containing protein
MSTNKRTHTNDPSSAPRIAAEAAGADDNVVRIRSTFAKHPQIMKISPDFVAGLPNQIRNLIDLLKRNEVMGLQKAVHQLRGACAGYGFDDATAPAARVEASIKSGKSLRQIAAEIDVLIKLLRRFEGYDQARESIAA